MSKQVSVGIKLTGDAKSFQQASQDARKSTEALSNANKPLRSQLLAVRREMQKMAQAGDAGSQAYKKMRTEAAQLQDTVDRVQTEIKMFADDALILNTVTDAFQGMTGAMQMTQGISALLGVENEKLTQTFVKLQALQSIQNGLQQVSNMLQKESRIVVLGKMAAVKVATAAQWLWNAAMTANPIGLIIAGIAALGAGIYALIRHFDVVTESVKKAWNWLRFWKRDSDVATEATSRLADSVNKYEAANHRAEKSLKRKADALEFEIKLLKAMGAEQDKITTKERELLQLALNRAVEYESGMQKYGQAWIDAQDRIEQAERALQIFDETQKTVERNKAKAHEEERKAHDESMKDKEEKIKATEDDRIMKEADAWARAWIERFHNERMYRAQLEALQEKSFEKEDELLFKQMEEKKAMSKGGTYEMLLIEQEYLDAVEALRKGHNDSEISLLDAQYKSGLISYKDYLNKKLELQLKYADEVESLIAEADYIEAWGAGIKTMAGDLEGAFNQTFNAIASGSEDAFKVMADAFKMALQRMVAQMAAKAAIFGILSLLTGGTGMLGKWATKQVGVGFMPFITGAAKMATGGIVPGGYPNDTYPALLSSGEKVVPPGKLGAERIHISIDGKVSGRDLALVLSRYSVEQSNIT